MSFSISIYGHGADPEDVKEIFENTVRGLRAVSPEGSSPISGSLSAEGISISASDVTDENEVIEDDEEGEDE